MRTCLKAVCLQFKSMCVLMSEKKTTANCYFLYEYSIVITTVKYNKIGFTSVIFKDRHNRTELGPFPFHPTRSQIFDIYLYIKAILI